MFKSLTLIRCRNTSGPQTPLWTAVEKASLLSRKLHHVGRKRTRLCGLWPPTISQRQQNGFFEAASSPPVEGRESRLTVRQRERRWRRSDASGPANHCSHSAALNLLAHVNLDTCGTVTTRIPLTASGWIWPGCRDTSSGHQASRWSGQPEGFIGPRMGPRAAVCPPLS